MTPHARITIDHHTYRVWWGGYTRDQAADIIRRDHQPGHPGAIRTPRRGWVDWHPDHHQEAPTWPQT